MEENKKPDDSPVPIHHYTEHDTGFKTPEQVAAKEHPEPDLIIDASELEDKKHDSPNHDKPSGLTTKKFHKKIWDKFLSLSKRQKIIVISVAGVLLIAIIVGLVYAFSSSPAKKPTPVYHPTIKKVIVPTTVASELTGLQVDPSVNKRPVTGVMIENSDAARPQSGLIDAGVVFEAVTEGGITRFLALYQDTQPTNIGPIRSVRPYFLSWDLGFDAPIAHVGGSPQALRDISSWDAKNLDEFYNGASYHRISSREAPHNVYTSMSDLNKLEASKGWTSSSFTGFPRKADAPAKTPTATIIDFSPSSYDFSVTYSYDTTTNTYNRSEAGTTMTDAGSGAQISPKVVVAMVVPLSQGVLDATGAYYSDFSVIGSGQTDIFQDGTETTGTWSKPTNNSQITFASASGTPIKFNAGQTWITALGEASEISYK